MGMNLDRETNKILSSLVFSLAQIDSFRRHFYENNFSVELSKIFSDIVQKNCLNKIDEYVNNIKHKFSLNNLDENNIAIKIISYFLEELGKELKNEEKKDFIIKKIFNGVFEFSSNYQKFKKEMPLILSFDLDDFRSEDYIFKEENTKYIRLEAILSKNFKSKLLNDFPEFNNVQAIQMPEIIFIHNINIKGNNLQYYLKMGINDYPYEMIYFALDSDDNDDEQKFFKVNNVWYKYSTKFNTIDNIKNIKDNLGTPRMICYQKNNEFIQSFLNTKDIFILEQKRILEIKDEHIIPEHEYEKYYLLNKNLLNDFISIFNTKKSNDTKYNEGQIKINKKNFLDFGTNKTKNANINFPINFLIIKENLFKSFLDEFKMKNNYGQNNAYNNGKKDERKPYLIKFGESLAFLKTKELKKETIYVFRYDGNEEKFEVEIILQYDKEGLFDDDLKNYISNRGGMEYFYVKKNLNFNKDEIQTIYNENGEKIGIFINILDMDKYINIFKYQMILTKKEKKNNNINKNDEIRNTDKQQKLEQISDTEFENPIFLAYKKGFDNQHN